MEAKKSKKATNNPVFNPEKSYAWKPNDVFPLTGATLQVLYNGLSESLNTPEAQKVLKDYQMFQMVQAILASEVEKGNIISQEEMEQKMKK